MVTAADPERAAQLATVLAEEYWKRRAELEPEVHTPEQAVAPGCRWKARCCWSRPPIAVAAVAPATAWALLEAALPGPALVPMVDPAAARACHDAGPRSPVTVTVGHRLEPRWGEPVTVTGRVLRLSEGRFRYRDGMEGDMGPSAVLEVPSRRGTGAVRILLTTHATYDWADEQFRSVDLDPAAAKSIVAKNPMDYHLTCSPIAAATVRNVPFRNLQRPWLPADPDIPNLRPPPLVIPATRHTQYAQPHVAARQRRRITPMMAAAKASHAL